MNNTNHNSNKATDATAIIADVVVMNSGCRCGIVFIAVSIGGVVADVVGCVGCFCNIVQMVSIYFRCCYGLVLS